MSASESRFGVVMALAEEFLERYRQGQRPSLKEYIDRHPELAAEIKEVFPAMALMENIALDDESLAGVATGPETAGGAAPPEQLGDYRILREVGRGGMGIVYEAEQVSLGRHVALKVLPRKVLLDEAQKRRFEREAKAAAKLHHTNIVPVFGVGEHEGLPYYVMQFIQGLGLDDVLDELKRMQGGTRTGGELRLSRKDVSAADVARSLLTGAFGAGEPGQRAGSVSDGHSFADASGSLPRSGDSFTLSSSSVKLPVSRVKGKKATYWQSVAHIGMQVADALEYAHKQGVQHRDIKPANLLLDTAGTVWVTDFGLARADNEDHLTNTGDIVGTLRYMPPEAFEGRADKRGDIYSLGLTLYEMLARQPAFADRDRHRLIKRVTTEEPARLDKLHPAIPRDLVTIAHKAIDREPSRRYQTAGELSADLQRFLDDEPIRARRLSNGERLRRWCRHHPGVATLTAALAVILLGLTVASLLVAARFDRQAQEQSAIADKEQQARLRAEKAEQSATQIAGEEAAARKDAEQARNQTDAALYFSRIALAEREWWANNVAGAETLLDKCRPQDGQPDRRGWEWHYLKRLCHADLLPPMRHRYFVQDVAFSPDGKHIVSAAGLPHWMGGVSETGGRPSKTPGELAVWDAATGRLIISLAGHTGSVWSVTYSPDGRWIASGSADGTVRLWNASDFTSRVILRGPWEAYRVRFVPDGKTLIVGTGEDLKICSLSERGEARSLPHAMGFRAASTKAFLAVSPDGTRLAAVLGSYQGQMILYDIKTGQPRNKLISVNGGLISPAFSPDGKRLAAGTNSGRLEIWDAVENRLLHDLRISQGIVSAVAFGPDGRRLATASSDQTVRLWDVQTGEELRIFRGHRSTVNCLAFSSDGRRLVSGDREDNAVRVWDVSRDPGGFGFNGTSTARDGECLGALAFSGDGPCIRVAQTVPGNPRILTWDSWTGTLLKQAPVDLLTQHVAPRRDFAFSADGRLLAGPSGTDNSIVKIWDTFTDAEITALHSPKGRIVAVAFHPDGRRLACATGRHVWIGDTTTGKELRRLPVGAEAIGSLTFSADGKLLAGASAKAATIWEAESGKPLHRFAAPGGSIHSIAFSPDGRRLAAARSTNVQVWDVASGQPCFAPLPASSVSSVVFSPDGKRLAATGMRGLVYLWDAASGQDILTLRGFGNPGTGHYGFTPLVCFSPDGKRLAANDWDGTINIWSAEELTAAGASDPDRRGARQRYFDFLLPQLNQRLQRQPANVGLWLERGRLFAQLGQHAKADADFTKAAALTPEELNRFPQAGWWVVGPYPENLQLPCPPEKDPDPSRPVTAVGSAKELRWQPAPTDPDGRVDLRVVSHADHISAYALTYVYSPKERTATLLVGGDDLVRVWLNGRLVHQTNRLLGWAWDTERVPVTLKAGRNTLLCKINNDLGPHYLTLRIADNLFDRAILNAQLGQWNAAADLFARGIARRPSAGAFLFRSCALAHLIAGDTAGYHRYLDRGFELYDQISYADFELAFAGVVLDGAVKAARLVELAEHALKRGKYSWFFYAAGMAHYRAGQFEKAVDRLRQSRGPEAELGLALAHHRLGHAKEARQWLDKAEQWYEKAVQDALASPTGTANLSGWMDWPGRVVLRREAHELILGKDLPNDPRLKQLADRTRDWFKKLDPATADYDVAILLNPNEPRLWQARGQRLTELKRTKEAEADFAKAKMLTKGNKAEPKK